MNTTTHRSLLLALALLALAFQPALGQVDVELPQITADAGETITIPIQVSDLEGENITSYQFTMEYNPSIVEVTEPDTSGTLTGNVEEQPNYNVNQGEGTIQVSLSLDQVISGSGTLLKLEATLQGAGTSALTFSQFQMFDDLANEVATDTQSGEVVSDAITASLPQLTGDAGSSIEMPVEIESLTGKSIKSYQFTVEYDPSVVTITGVDTSGTLTGEAGVSPEVNPGQGEIRVSLSSEDTLSGSGTLLKLEATLQDAGTSALTFSQFQLFNDVGNEVESDTQSGEIVSQGIVVSLPMRSGNVDETVSLPLDVDNFAGEGVTSYEFTIEYDPSVLSITGVDTSGTITGDSGISPEVNSGTGQIQVSAFSDQQLSGEGPLLKFEAVAQDKGETTLHFQEASLFDDLGNALSVTPQDGMFTTTGIDIQLPSLVSPLSAGSETIPVTVEDLTDFNASSYQFTVSYNSSILTITGVDTSGTITGAAGLDPQVNTSEGTIQVSVASSDALQGGGTLLKLNATLESAGTSSLTFSDLGVFDLEGNQITTSPENGSIAVSGATAQAQFIHNAADPNADVVDIYFGDRRQFNDVAFRTATGFLDVPAGVDIDVGLAPANSESSADILASAEVNFGEDEAYTVVATGVASPSNFAPNPDGQNIGLQVLRRSGAQLNASDDGQVRIRTVHGVTDAPTIDVETAGGTALFSGLTYGAISEGYVGVPAESAVVQVIASGSGDEVAAFDLPLSDFGGQALTVLASGFLNPGQNNDGPSFGLLLVQADGTATFLSPGTNSPPQITDVPSGSVALPNTFTGTVEATDPDNDPLTYEISPDPANASIDTTGAFQFNPRFSQRDTGVTFTATVTDEAGASDDSTFTVTVNPLDRGPISVDQSTVTFGDATENSNYQLLGLPGQVDLPVEETLEGQHPDDWRAFWDTGAGQSLQDGLIEFDEQDQYPQGFEFNFRSGLGYWILARNPWPATDIGPFQPVSLDSTGNASIPLNDQDQWTVISNPLGKDISWADVQAENGGLDEQLWQKSPNSNSYEPVNTFQSAAQEGEAYYFFNAAGLDSLEIPYFGESEGSVRPKKNDRRRIVKLSALEGDTPQSSIWVGFDNGAKEGLDGADHFAPPSFFAKTELELTNEKIQSEQTLAFDVRPAASEGQTFHFTLRTKPGTSLKLTANGLGQFGPEEVVRLYNPSEAATYNLQSGVKLTPETSMTEFVLVIGDQSYVQDQESDLKPDRVKLHQNYPNPFREQTTFKFALPEEMNVRVEVYDLLGRRVQTLVDAKRTAGIHTVQWQGRADGGRRLASGTYLVRLQAGNQTRTRKLVLVK